MHTEFFFQVAARFFFVFSAYQQTCCYHFWLQYFSAHKRLTVTKSSVVKHQRASCSQQTNVYSEKKELYEEKIYTKCTRIQMPTKRCKCKFTQ